MTSQVGVHKIRPVIYSGTAGGPGEYKSSDDPNNGAMYVIPANLPNPAGRVLEAWYTPYHNIGALQYFALIEVERHDDAHVRLTVGSYPGMNQRVRLTLNILYES